MAKRETVRVRLREGTSQPHLIEKTQFNAAIHYECDAAGKALKPEPTEPTEVEPTGKEGQEDSGAPSGDGAASSDEGDGDDNATTPDPSDGGNKLVPEGTPNED